MLNGYNEIMIRNNPEYTKSCIELPKIVGEHQCLCPPELQMNTMIDFIRINYVTNQCWRCSRSNQGIRFTNI